MVFYQICLNLKLEKTHKMKDELEKHGIDLFPYQLADIAPVPDSRERRGGRMPEDTPVTQEIQFPETYDEWLDRKGLY